MLFNETRTPLIQDLKGDLACYICHDPYLSGEAPEIPIRLRCGHVFGQVCIVQWFKDLIKEKRISTCPLCREPAFSYETMIRLLYGNDRRTPEPVEGPVEEEIIIGWTPSNDEETIPGIDETSAPDDRFDEASADMLVALEDARRSIPQRSELHSIVQEVVPNVELDPDRSGSTGAGVNSVETAPAPPSENEHSDEEYLSEAGDSTPDTDSAISEEGAGSTPDRDPAIREEAEEHTSEAADSTPDTDSTISEEAEEHISETVESISDRDSEIREEGADSDSTIDEMIAQRLFWLQFCEGVVRVAEDSSQPQLITILAEEIVRLHSIKEYERYIELRPEMTDVMEKSFPDLHAEFWVKARTCLPFRTIDIHHLLDKDQILGFELGGKHTFTTIFLLRLSQIPNRNTLDPRDDSATVSDGRPAEDLG